MTSGSVVPVRNLVWAECLVFCFVWVELTCCYCCFKPLRFWPSKQRPRLGIPSLGVAIPVAVLEEFQKERSHVFTSQSVNMVKLHGLHGEIEPTTAQASTSQANLPVAKPRKAPPKNLFVRKFLNQIAMTWKKH